MQAIRLIFQLFFLEIILYHAVLFSLGDSYKNCESYCPFGAVETLALFAKSHKFPCAVNEFNYSILIGVLLITVLFKRAFCSWVCPLGAVNELITRARAYFSKYAPLNETAMKFMYGIKYALLGIIVYATYINYDLVFRPYCPYFTAFGLHGHTTVVLSYFILANALLVTFFIKMGFCRTLCPFGAFLNFFNVKTVCKIYRDEKACDCCRLCDSVCLSEIKVSQSIKIESRDCTMCLSCVSACGKKGSLKIGI
ncbi:MAG TPA: 4Fe-4S binding protein [Candidatus Wallbacteria bacterium]|nr:MAG: putative electron transport protein YccM [bacterium ADurb.Bin243]HOD39870.1 4Fe-4S binding protein [Candidatus Wallbacteria bacterium]HPG56751.1 4Fe-4S binding protein [Candidatus Wallbacteria bacterium]